MALAGKLMGYLEPHLDKVPFKFTVLGSIGGALCLVYVAKAFHVVLSVLLAGGYDNVQASFRTSSGQSKNESGAWKKKTIARAFNAHNNSWEAFTAFAVAVLMALVAGKEGDELTKLCNAFLLVRSTYIIVYILAFNLPLSVIRSAVFGAGFMITLQIMLLAAGGSFLADVQV